MSLIASLPWYDMPAVRQQNNQLWSLIRGELEARGISEAPVHLTRDHLPKVQWQSPGLLLSQCCGLDLHTALASALIPIARPVFTGLDCVAGEYFSHVVQSSEAPVDRIAINSPYSRSGCSALIEWMRNHSLTIRQVVITGSHEQSLALVRRGEAGLAAIDAHSWRFLETAGIHRVGETTRAPSPPYVIHRQQAAHVATVRAALLQAVKHAAPTLLLASVVDCERADYDSLQEQIHWSSDALRGASVEALRASWQAVEKVHPALFSRSRARARSRQINDLCR